jgi:hypothetical protein
MTEEKRKPGINRGYKVGYGQPPENTRFQPRQSGNPSGRPKRKTFAEILREEFDQTQIVTTESGRKSMTGEEVVARNLARSAMNANLDVIKLLLILNVLGNGKDPAN